MRKVKLTQKQARMFENYKYAVKTLLQKRVCDNCPTNIDSLPIDDVVKAIVYGYEVEREFKVGDWVVSEDGYIGEIEFINEVEGWANIGYSKDTKERGVCLAKTYDLIDIVRHATPSEIVEEKERRFWKRHGRDVREIRSGDIIYSYSTGITFVRNDNARHVTDFDGFQVVCFAENRLDVRDDE